MKKFSDPFLSRRMIETRKQGFTWSLFLRRSVKAYLVLFLIYAGILSLFAYLNHWMAFWLLIGMLAGCVLRDIGWVRRVRQTWPYTERITDWEKVERLAGDSSPDQPNAS